MFLSATYIRQATAKSIISFRRRKERYVTPVQQQSGWIYAASMKVQTNPGHKQISGYSGQILRSSRQQDMTDQLGCQYALQVKSHQYTIKSETDQQYEQTVKQHQHDHTQLRIRKMQSQFQTFTVHLRTNCTTAKSSIPSGMYCNKSTNTASLCSITSHACSNSFSVTTGWYGALNNRQNPLLLPKPATDTNGSWSILYKI